MNRLAPSPIARITPLPPDTTVSVVKRGLALGTKFYREESPLFDSELEDCAEGSINAAAGYDTDQSFFKQIVETFRELLSSIKLGKSREVLQVSKGRGFKQVAQDIYDSRHSVSQYIINDRPCRKLKTPSISILEVEKEGVTSIYIRDRSCGDYELLGDSITLEDVINVSEIVAKFQPHITLPILPNVIVPDAG